jgi:hypothetical protein
MYFKPIYNHVLMIYVGLLELTWITKNPNQHHRSWIKILIRKVLFRVYFSFRFFFFIGCVSVPTQLPAAIRILLFSVRQGHIVIDKNESSLESQFVTKQKLIKKKRELNQIFFPFPGFMFFGCLLCSCSCFPVLFQDIHYFILVRLASCPNAAPTSAPRPHPGPRSASRPSTHTHASIAGTRTPLGGTYVG